LFTPENFPDYTLDVVIIGCLQATVSVCILGLKFIKVSTVHHIRKPVIQITSVSCTMLMNEMC